MQTPEEVGSGVQADRQSDESRTAGAPVRYRAVLREHFLARVATNGPDGPSIRPVLYLWESGAFWWVTAAYAKRLRRLLALDPRVALVVDEYDPTTGLVLKVTAEGVAEFRPLDRDLAVRCTARVLGDDPDGWDAESRSIVFDDPTARLVRMRPKRLVARDLSYEPPACMRRQLRDDRRLLSRV